MSGPAMSIVVPAHDEEPIIGGFLRGLVESADDGELEILVVCNGCTDRTADVARAAGGPVEVLEIDIGHKPTALNVADEHARTFPRFYVDADVRIGVDALRACADALVEGALAAAPALRVDTTRSSWPVRSYYRVWSRLPWVTEAMVGSGVFGVSREGRDRFDRFPDDGADDLWFSAQFAPDERVSVADQEFVVDASTSTRQLVKRRSRIVAANQLVADRLSSLPGAPETGASSLLSLLRSEPRLTPHAIPFVLISLAARWRARRMLAAGEVAWEGDQRVARSTPDLRS